MEGLSKIDLQGFPKLETPCGKCQGHGRHDEGDHKQRRCDWCNGSGYEPTDVGELVLSLMRHNFKPMLQDATDE